MTLWILAWSNLRFNFFRTLMIMLVLTIAVSSLILFQGYINYSAEGMRAGFVAQTGAMQIAHKDFWSTRSEEKLLLKETDYIVIDKVLKEAYGINSYQRLLSMIGLIGTSQRSRFFSGEAYEYFTPTVYNSIINRDEAATDLYGIVIGKDLGEFLYSNVGDFVSLLSTGMSGIALITLPIIGFYFSGNRNLDGMVTLMTLENAHRFYDMKDNEFDRLRIDIVDIDDMPKIKDDLQNALHGTPYEIKDWLQLNPSFKEVDQLNRSQAKWTTLILILFIITAITQTLQIVFFHRMGEFGTLRAIGFTPKAIWMLLLRETTLMNVVGIVSGIILGLFVVFITRRFQIRFTPPFSSVSYPLILIVYLSDLLKISGLIYLVSFMSSLYPAYLAISRRIVDVMKHI